MSDDQLSGAWPSQQLPSSWVWIPFDQFWSDFTDSQKKLPQKSYRQAGRFAVVDQGEALIGGYTDDESLLSPAPLPAIVFGDHTRAVKFIDVPFVQGADGVRVLGSPEGIDPIFAFKALCAVNLPNKGYSRHFKFLKSTSFPLAPLEEQKRIVAKLDALNAKSARARTELARIATLVSRYKQAMLGKAFSGELTAGQISQLNTLSTPSFTVTRHPSHWRLMQLGDIADIKSGITLGKKRKPEDQLLELPYLRVANVQRGWLDLAEIKTIQVTAKEAEALFLRDGDVLMNEGGDRDKLGRGWVWDSQIADCIHQNHVFRVRLAPKTVPPRFLSYYTNEFGQKHFFDEGKQTTNLASISKSKLSAMEVPIPPFEEAVEIVRRIESAFARIDRLASEAKRALELVGKLDDAILAKAFRGELEPQDENDEPAEKLLERIHAERAAIPKTKRGRGTLRAK
ncbi:restriction endonuclease subunit S [Ensifer sp. HO-A22]|uniref:Restriction endonuclease subunit S n=1 Tax=Ensifer oleiphilus TaxID=2742698 RepID=A0A7Y6UL89_9HYPH|nr:restriction endonuclease subunit S [Ensifer oleiphilus]NVD37649.1 restriction endonuclease subunit S [Ensifer oleiphilus]